MDRQTLSLLFGTLCCLYASALSAQNLPADRRTDWTLAGLNSEPFTPVVALNAQDFGLPNDSLTPADSIWTIILDSAAKQPCMVQLAAGSYLFKKPWLLGDSIIIRGAGNDSTRLYFDLSSFSAGQQAIRIPGSAVNQWYSLATDAAKDDRTISLDSVTGWTAGDYILLRDNDSSKVFSSWAIHSTGQIVLLDSVDGTTLYLHSPLRRDYLLASGPEVQLLHPVTQVGIENLYLERLDPTSGQTSNIFYNYAANCWVKCVESNLCNFAHIEVNRSTNLLFQGNILHHAHAYGGGGQGYGIMLEFTTGECLLEDNIGYHLRHSYIMQAGSNGNVVAYNYSFDPNWDDAFLPANSAGDLVLHGNYPYLNLFEGNVVQNMVIDNSHGINGPYNTLYRNRGELYGLFMNTGPASDSQNIIGNEITNNGTLLGLYVIAGTGQFEYANNHLGTIKPNAGDTMSTESLFLSGPLFNTVNDLWPPIGLPNQLDAQTIPAEDRWTGGATTNCSGFTYVEPPPDTGTAIQPILTSSEIAVYPNPASNAVILSLSKDLRGPATFYLYNLMGQQVLSQPITQSQTSIPLDLPGGVYVYKLRAGNQVLHSGKLVVVE